MKRQHANEDEDLGIGTGTVIFFWLLCAAAVVLPWVVPGCVG